MESSKVALRWPQDHLRRPRGGSRGPQEGSKSAQDGPRWDQHGPELRHSVPRTCQHCINLKAAMRCPRTRQRRFKMASRSPQEALEEVQEGSKGAQDGSRWDQHEPALRQNVPRTCRHCINLKSNHAFETIEILRVFSSKLKPETPIWSQCETSWHHMKASRQY